MYTRMAVHKVARLTATGQVVTVAARVFGVIVVGGTAVSTVALFNNTDGTGTATFNASAPIGDTTFIDLSHLGPLMFDTALYATIAGAGAIVFVIYD